MKFTGAVVLGQLKCSHESSEGEQTKRGETGRFVTAPLDTGWAVVWISFVNE